MTNSMFAARDGGAAPIHSGRNRDDSLTTRCERVAMLVPRFALAMRAQRVTMVKKPAAEN